MSLFQTQAVKEKILTLPLGKEVNSFLNYLHIEAGLAENSILGYGRDLKNFLDFCCEKKIKNPQQLNPLSRPDLPAKTFQRRKKRGYYQAKPRGNTDVSAFCFSKCSY